VSDHLQLHVASDRPVAVLRASGRLDADGAQGLKNHIQELIEEGHRHLVLVMNEVSFVASSGIGIMLVVADILRRRDGRLIVANPSNAVTSVIELLNLDAFLEIVPSEKAALAALETADEHV
jgi:anti-anti-sigma factor